MATKPTSNVQYYDSTAAVWRTAPTDTVQRISWNTGRQNLTDQFQGGTCSVYGRLPSTLPSVPTIGAPAEIRVSNTGQDIYFAGYVSDYRVIYGIKPAYDTYELIIEGPFSAAARRLGDVSATAGNSTAQVFETLNSLTSGQIQNGGGFTTTTSAQTFTGQLSNPAQTAIATDGGVIVEQRNLTVKTQPQAFGYGHNSPNLGNIIAAVFSDDFTVSTIVINAVTYYLGRYTEIEFLSAAYNTGTKVTVQASGLADQTSGTGAYGQTVSTINQTTSQASDLAGYLRTKYELSAQTPYTLRFTGANQTYPNEALRAADQGNVGQLVRVDFRGTTYYCIIEGIQMDANPSDWSCTIALSSSLQNAFLKLNNPVFGTLDYNKLGF